MAVEARFICERKEALDQVSVQVTLRASTRGRDNTEWAPYTPSGILSMVVVGSAGGDFVEGGRYRLLLERTDDEPAT